MTTARTFSSLLVVSLLCLHVPSAHALGCGDVDGDGAVNAGDALVVLRAAVDDPRALACDNQTIGELEERVAALESLLSHFTVEGDTLVLTGMNLQIVNGLGATDGKDGKGTAVNGLGNLIIGYNEEPTFNERDLRDDFEHNGIFGFEKPRGRGGSHNLVIGAGHAYESYGGVVAGEDNAIAAPGAAVLGGFDNTAHGTDAAVLGGSHNQAAGEDAVVAGGTFNRSFTKASAVSGGLGNVALGFASVVSGGEHNRAVGSRSAVTGGSYNVADGTSTVVSGGALNQAYGYAVTVGGGHACTLSGTWLWQACDLSDVQ